MTVAGQIPTKGQTVTGPKTVAAKKAPAKAPAKKAPGKAVAKVVKPEDKSEFTAAKAKAHTAKMQKSGEQIFSLVKDAYLGRIWLALGHKTWDEYLDKELGGFPLVLPREKKKASIVSLSQAGMSTRAIAAATGEAQRTVARHVKDAKSEVTEPSGSVDKDKDVIDVPESDITEIKDEQPGESTDPEPDGNVVQGIDGRKIDTTNIGKKPTVVNVVSAARTIAKDMESVRIRLDALFSREDYEENKVDVQATLETPVGDFIDTLVEEFADLISERAPSTEPEPAV